MVFEIKYKRCPHGVSVEPVYTQRVTAANAQLAIYKLAWLFNNSLYYFHILSVSIKEYSNGQTEDDFGYINFKKMAIYEWTGNYKFNLDRVNTTIWIPRDKHIEDKVYSLPLRFNDVDKELRKSIQEQHTIKNKVKEKKYKHIASI